VSKHKKSFSNIHFIRAIGQFKDPAQMPPWGAMFINHLAHEMKQGK